MSNKHAVIEVTGTWGGDIEGRDKKGRAYREISKALRQEVKCHCCGNKLVVGWLREDGLYYCECCVEVPGREHCRAKHTKKQIEVAEHIHVEWLKGANK